MSSNNDKTPSDVMYTAAYTTLFQGVCFLGVSLLRGRVSFIPKDPLVLIGTVYALAGLGLAAYGSVLYPGQNFWGPSLAPSIIFRGPFGIFEGHELMEKDITKNGLTIKFCFEHCKAHSFTLKIKTFSFCVKEQLKMPISLSDRSSIVWEEIVSTCMTKMFWK